MARGRCEPCGYEDGSAKTVERHIATCPEAVRWFQEGKDVPEPEAAMEARRKYLESDEHEMAREESRAEKSLGYRREAEEKLRRQRARWGDKRPVPTVDEEHAQAYARRTATGERKA